MGSQPTPQFASLEAILALRETVIIAGTDRDSPYFPGDEAATTRHIGVFLQGRCIGCATLLQTDYDGEPAWQLRGMATEPAFQGQGIGRAILEFAEHQLLREEPSITLLWCNAREQAATFYERHGWRTVSERFDIPGVGPHYRMVKRIGTGTI